MTTILSVTLPFFAVIGCGYAAAMVGVFGEASRSGLNRFVFYFALPVLLFSVMSDAGFDQGFDWRFPIGWGLVSITLFALTFGIARSLFGLKTAEAAVHALSGVYGNAGYVGIPLITVAFGTEASVPVILCLAVDLVLMIPIAMVAIEAADGSRERARIMPVLAKTSGALVRNPLILPIAAGTCVSVLSLELPAIVERFTGLLGAAAAPCALFALGSSLYGQPVRGAMMEVGTITVTKLLVHPLLVWYVMFKLLGVDELWGFAAVVTASMPVAATVYVLAQQYHTYVVRTSTVIAVSTAISILTVSTILLNLSAAGAE